MTDTDRTHFGKHPRGHKLYFCGWSAVHAVVVWQVTEQKTSRGKN